jgi:hypothetical protein
MFTGNNYYWEHKIVYILFFNFHKYIDRIKVSADSNTNYFMLSSVYRIFTKLYDRVPENFETLIRYAWSRPEDDPCIIFDIRTYLWAETRF